LRALIGIEAMPCEIVNSGIEVSRVGLLRELIPVLVAGLVPFLVLALIVIGTAASLVAWQPPITQISQFGTANSHNGITALASDGTGIYAAGFVGYSNVTPTYLFVSRYDLNGRQVWTQHFGDPCCSQISIIAAGNDGVYVAGDLSSSFGNFSSFVRKYDLNGNLVWNVLFGNGFIPPSTLSVATTGIYVGGFTAGSTVVKRYSFQGNLLSTQSFGNNTNRVLTFADTSGIYVSIVSYNTLLEKYDPNWTLAWNHTCSCIPTKITGDGAAVYLVGTVAVEGRQDGFLDKYDLDGNRLWSTKFSAPVYISIDQVDVAVDSSGLYSTQTSFSPGTDIVMKYDGNGNNVWSIQLPWTTGAADDRATAIALTNGGAYVGSEERIDVNGLAFIALVGKSSSLVFFGTNPPFSFILVALLTALAGACVFWFRRRLKKMKIRTPSTEATFRSQKIPRDAYHQR
jgi:hypothetical protein